MNNCYYFSIDFFEQAIAEDTNVMGILFAASYSECVAKLERQYPNIVEIKSIMEIDSYGEILEFSEKTWEALNHDL